MKRLSLVVAAGMLIVLFAGCTPKTAGQDSAYLNQNRGAEGAQITQAEARQYRRQQALTADEIRLENMKRRQDTDAIHEGASATRSTVSAIESVKNLLGF
jgi:hypothetical protein